jgi:hypothetical protein
VPVASISAQLERIWLFEAARWHNEYTTVNRLMVDSGDTSTRATRQDLFLRQPLLRCGRISADKGISQQVIAITERSGIRAAIFFGSLRREEALLIGIRERIKQEEEE